MPSRSWTADDKRVVGARQKWRCAVCDSMLESTFEVDHIVALHDNGADKLENAQALCCGCHAKKTQQERMRRQQLARERLAELQTKESLVIPLPVRDTVVLKPMEEVILDAENPFAKYAYIKNND